MHCCICGGSDEAEWCSLCKHRFCVECRKKHWDRGFAAVKEWLMGEPPKFCDH